MIINIEWSLGYLDPVEVVHSEDGAPLVLKADEAEALGFACLFVPNQVDINYLSVPEWEGRKKKKVNIYNCTFSFTQRKGYFSAPQPLSWVSLTVFPWFIPRYGF